MGAARWVVVGTALVAAAAAFHLLMSPAGTGERPSAAGSVESVDSERGAGNGAAPRGVAIEEADGPPQEELDAASREAMRDFLRGSLEGAESSGKAD